MLVMGEITSHPVFSPLTGWVFVVGYEGEHFTAYGGDQLTVGLYSRNWRRVLGVDYGGDHFTTNGRVHFFAYGVEQLIVCR